MSRSLRLVHHSFSLALPTTSPACRWDARVTHVVAPELRRAVKTLAAFAAGVWVLRTTYVEASARARALVEPVSQRLRGSCSVPLL